MAVPIKPIWAANVGLNPNTNKTVTPEDASSISWEKKSFILNWLHKYVDI